MKPLLFPLSFCIAVAAMAAPTTAQEVRDGSVWSGGGVTFSIGITETGDGNVAMQAVSASGFSGVVSGTEGPNSTPNRPTAEEGGTMGVPTATGVLAVSVNGGHMEWRKEDGTWARCKRGTKKRSPDANWGGGHSNGPGEEVVTMPWTLYDEVTLEWWRSQ